MMIPSEGKPSGGTIKKEDETMFKKILCAVFCVMMLLGLTFPSLAAEKTEEKSALTFMWIQGTDNGRKVSVSNGTTLRMKPCNAQKLKVEVGAWSLKNIKKADVTGSVIYRTSDPRVASVSSKGVTSAGRVGTTTVTVYHRASGLTMQFKVKVEAPSTPKIKQIRSGSYAIQVKWDAVAGASGYEIEFVLNKRWTWLFARSVKVLGGSTKAYTIPSWMLEKGAIYDVRIRALYLDGTKTRSTSWSAKKTVTVQR